jgi:hypothetical protein
MPARWGRMKNFRFYELQAAVPEDPTASPDWDTVLPPQRHQRLPEPAPHARRQNHVCPRPKANYLVIKRESKLPGN